MLDTYNISNNLNKFWGFYHGINVGAGSPKTPPNARPELVIIYFTNILRTLTYN
jgi:hypothetical protein